MGREVGSPFKYSEPEKAPDPADAGLHQPVHLIDGGEGLAGRHRYQHLPLALEREPGHALRQQPDRLGVGLNLVLPINDDMIEFLGKAVHFRPVPERIYEMVQSLQANKLGQDYHSSAWAAARSSSQL
jgi:hypothetical protein